MGINKGNPENFNASDFMDEIRIGDQTCLFYNLHFLDSKVGIALARLPFSIRVLVENLLRKCGAGAAKAEEVLAAAQWQPINDHSAEIPFYPARVLMQDFTGVPAVVDLAAMRDAMAAAGKDPSLVNPLIPVELIVDHSVQVDFCGTQTCREKNVAKEYERNGERYRLLKWAQKSFDNFRVVPPNSGICHQVNLEYLGRGAMRTKTQTHDLLFADTLVGTDSHTPMINSIGVLGWGVGGIEAEAVMLGQPYFMPLPQVIGVELTGKLNPGVTATDMVLTVTNRLRQMNVVEKFVEFYGPGLKNLKVPDRATIANMSPEYGATMGFFPIDEQTIDYFKITNREEQGQVVEAWAKACGLFRNDDDMPEFSDTLKIDLADIVPCLAGPARPQDLVKLSDLETAFSGLLGTTAPEKKTDIRINDMPAEIGNGSVVIAAITSCTNTSNPYALMGAGLLARNAVQKGVFPKPHVKTSFAPGSKVVVDYLSDAGLMPYLEGLGFHVAAFGCTTCIGNSGPLHPEIEKQIKEKNLAVAAVLSGNRNFEARIHQLTKANFLASPMLVVAFAICGRVDVDLAHDPVALDPNGEAVYLKDIWPGDEEIDDLVRRHVKKEDFKNQYEQIYQGDSFWKALDITQSVTFNWDQKSTYIRNPPYFENFSLTPQSLQDLENTRALMALGDSVTTDHISPAGAIPESYPAGIYLKEQGVGVDAFNSYGSRRGNHEVMMRGTFGNIRIKNQMVTPQEGSFTKKFPEGDTRFVFDVAKAYRQQEVPLIVLAGKEYGTGSSRDWAAKGSALLGVRAVIARSYERIHRSNLVGMGVLPLQFHDGDGWQELGLDGSELFSVKGMEQLTPHKELQIAARKADGTIVTFQAIARLDTDIDVEYMIHGGILPYVLRKLIKET
ncbi:aconitate hydratase AcnA [uncultured Desulfobacter sp.]|uniref:aconitate hydratase AcnA n=1 Tax=uncultured Desulfobacter sp. TaxID=240139 RepID=UPI002AABB93F|nr:aconitate hydratase AcnA [uncultured Desulfobacter sp.]